jgi:hypothetical protein
MLARDGLCFAPSGWREQVSAGQVGELAAMISDEYQSQPDYTGCIIYPSSLVLCPNSS